MLCVCKRTFYIYVSYLFKETQPQEYNRLGFRDVLQMNTETSAEVQHAAETVKLDLYSRNIRAALNFLSRTPH
jgi:hypothetical protein